MSGICGIVALDGKAPARSEIAAMTAALERRGPDGTHHWLEGQAALGHTLLATTPEALVEQLPLTDPASGCTITADVRLDNREELIPRLRLEDEERVIGDGELILRAYLEWGEDCPKHLLGDFAFAIWDPRSCSLFAARDHLGMRQLIYHHEPGRHFVFGTEAEALLAHPAVPRQINEGRIADYLDNLEGLDLTSTFFVDLFRLPPAHTLSANQGGMKIRRYWWLETPREIHFDSDEDYVDAFLEVFKQAVQSRLRGAGPVGAALSGGIDSNAIVAVAARLLAQEGRGPLMTFSGIGPDPAECVETRAIIAAAAAPNIEAHLIDHSKLGERLAEVSERTRACAEPFDAHMTLLQTVYLEAHRAGIKIVLDGVGGDVVLSSGNVVAERLAAGQLSGAIAELGDRPRSIRQWRWRTRQLLAALWITLAPTGLYKLRRNLSWKYHDRRALNGKATTAAKFSRRVDLPARRRLLRQHPESQQPFGRDYRRHCIIHPHLTVGRERYDRIASSMAVEPRDPYLDLRVIRFCLSLPTNQVQANGVTKMILRQAMRGWCPPEVLSRRAKEHLGWDFTQCFLPHLRQIGGFDRRRVAPYVSSSVLSRADPTSTKTMDRQHWFDLCVLTEWLYRNLPRNAPDE